jgi:hypothetical protein
MTTLRNALALLALLTAGAASAQERSVELKLRTTEPALRLFESADGGQIGTLARDKFPMRAGLIREGETGRIQIRLPETGQIVWLRGRDVQILDNLAKPMECDPVTRPAPQALTGDTRIAAAATRGGRGAGLGECR